MKIGRLVDYQGTIEQFPGSENVTATFSYQRFCYTINRKMAILAIKTAGIERINSRFKKEVKDRLLDGRRPFAHIRTW